MAATKEIPNPFAVNNDTSDIAKAAKETAHEKMLRDSQAAKPLTAKEKSTLDDTGKLANGIIKSFTDAGATPAQASALLKDFVDAKDAAGRAKVFTDSNVAPPQIVNDYESKYGAGTTDAIHKSISLAKRIDQKQKAEPAIVDRAHTTSAPVPALEAAADPLDKLIPGWTETKAAVAASSDQSLSPEQRMAKAAPLFESALNAAKLIKPDDIDAAKLKISAALSQLTGGRAQTLADLGKEVNAPLVREIEADSAKLAQVEELMGKDALLNRARRQELGVSETYAQTLSKTASDLRIQANREPENSTRLNGEANAMTDKAVTVLKTFGQRDSDFGVAVASDGDPAKASHRATLNQKRIQEEIAQANRGEAINPKTAGAISGATSAMETMDHAVMGEKFMGVNFSEFARPLTTVLNPTIDDLNYAGQAPYVGVLPRFVSSGLSFPMDYTHAAAGVFTPTAIDDLAAAKVDDSVAAKAIVQKKEDSALQGAVSLVSDLVSGQIGVNAAKWAPTLLAKLPQLEETAFTAALKSGSWQVKLGAVVTAGVGFAFGSRWAMDELSHDFLGSKRMSVGELASHSTAALAAAYTARGLSSAMQDVEGQRFINPLRTALTSGSTSAVFSLGEINPLVTDQATGRNYTAADTLMNMGENSIFGGVGGVASRAITPYLKYQGTYGISALFKSNAGLKTGEEAVESKYLSRLWSTSGKAIATRAVGGYVLGVGGDLLIGAKEDGHGNKLSWGQIAYDANVAGLITAGGAVIAPPLVKYSLNKAAVPFNASRRFLGRTAETVGNFAAGKDTFLGDTVVKPLNVLGQKVVTPETKQYVRAHALQISTALSGFYEDHKLGEIDRLSDLKAEELRKEQTARH
ncbi:MAG: hypothetical protein P4L53_02130 [Candidatus Obscuribacterales bacterium]|nr:hypothetical protein [Candidatus Obscuribacterales bacterium]